MECGKEGVGVGTPSTVRHLQRVRGSGHLCQRPPPCLIPQAALVQRRRALQVQLQRVQCRRDRGRQPLLEVRLQALPLALRGVPLLLSNGRLVQYTRGRPTAAAGTVAAD